MTSDFTNSLEQKTALTEVQIDFKENEFRDFSIADKELVWEKMSALFEINPKLDAEYRLSYFRWFTDLSWKFFLNRESEFVVEMAIKRQVPMAILLDFDVWRELLKYLALRTVGEQDAQNLYSKIKTVFLESEAVLGVWEDNEVTVAEIVKEFFSIKQRGSDSLEMAEFNSKLQEILFSTNDPLVDKYILVDPDTAIYRFTELMLFFYLMEPKDIWYAVDAFLHPELAGAEEKPVESAISRPALSVSSAPLAASAAATAKPQPPQVIMPKKEEHKPPLSNPPLPRPSGESPKPVKPAVPVRPTPQQVKSQIESQFKKDAGGNFIDIEGVYKKLGELAEKYDDSKINDLIYYDESSGKFLWK